MGETLTFRTTLAAAVVAVAIAVAYFPIWPENETKHDALLCNAMRRDARKTCQVTPLAAAMAVL